MDNPTIGFGLDYAGELIYCEAVMGNNHYEIRFDGKFIGTVEHTDNFEWIQASGTILPQQIIDEIGGKIESHYL
jgi:hypothetical protein